MPGRFTDLAQLLPPHVIRDERDYDKAIAFLDKLLARPKLTKGQTGFFETWSVLIAAYESQCHATDVVVMDGLEALRHLVDANGMTASDLGLLLGNRSLGSKVLRG
jgi:antitoxin component HigA of HigAB toxin-antitoxin module